LPTKAEHRTRAEHDEFFVKNTGNPFFDWQVTGTFYSALHYVDAYLATQNIHPATHSIRLGYVQSDPKLKPVFRDYRDLLNESRTGRYEAATIFVQGDVTSAQRRLDSIKKAVLPHI
jgi:uncharacterized protein (UPF0332 family)